MGPQRTQRNYQLSLINNRLVRPQISQICFTAESAETTEEKMLATKTSAFAKATADRLRHEEKLDTKSQKSGVRIWFDGLESFG